MKLERRDFVLGAVGVGLQTQLHSCCFEPEPAPEPRFVSLREGLPVDAHCHVFNAADLPASTFLLGTKFPLRKYIAGSPILSRSLSYLLDALLGLLELAPNAKTEHAFLDGEAVDDPLQKWDEGVGGFLHDLLGSGVPRGSRRWPNGLPEQLEAERRALGEALRGELKGNGIRETPAADQFYSLGETLEGTVRFLNVALLWCRQLSDFRIRNVDRLFELYGQERLGIGLCLPALVDFHRWLPDIEDAHGAPRVSLEDQVELMERVIALRPGVHPMLAVDPLEDWDRTEELLNRCFNSDGAGKVGNGFAGIKLYPPMGFAALDNTHLRSVSEDYAATVEQNLRQVYEYCERYDVPIMAHCTATNSTPTAERAGTYRADNWRAVIEQYPDLRINLAHFGGVEDFVSRFGKGEANPEQAAIGELMEAGQVWSDIAHESGVDSASFRANLAAALSDYADQYPNAPKRLLYGSDWIMLGLDKKFPNYLGNWEQQAALLPTAFEPRRFFGDNALDFLGVTRPGLSRTRFERFYADVGQSPLWLQSLGLQSLDGGL